jgi:hypothetical protein
MLDEAKRWFEASTVICRFVPEGQERAEKVHLFFQPIGIFFNGPCQNRFRGLTCISYLATARNDLYGAMSSRFRSNRPLRLKHWQLLWIPLSTVLFLSDVFSTPNPELHAFSSTTNLRTCSGYFWPKSSPRCLSWPF